MPRGGPPMPLEALSAYFRGARFSLLAMKMRHGESAPELAADVDRTVAMVDQYREDAAATLRLKQERAEGGGGEAARPPG